MIYTSLRSIISYIKGSKKVHCLLTVLEILTPYINPLQTTSIALSIGEFEMVKD